MAGKAEVLLDTSVLINFARIGRLDLLASHPLYSFSITDHVRDELTDHYVDQLDAVQAALENSTLTEITADQPQELEDFVNLVAMKSLGTGECSAIAVAKNRSIALAIDDVRARKKAVAFHSEIALLDTEHLVVTLIQKDVLSVEEADDIKLDWETNHRFKLPFGSFSEKV